MLALKHHKLDAWLGQDSIRAVDARVQVTNISWKTAAETGSGESAGLDGRLRQRIRRDALTVTIEFTLFEFLDIQAREAAIENVNAWARDGYLRISTKPGRRVWVQCTKRADVETARDHNASFSLEFETAEAPFWEDAQPTAFTLTGTSGSTMASIPGTRECAPADVTITPTGGTLNALTLTLGESEMAFENLGVAQGASLLLAHDGNGYLTISSSGASKYACRTGESDDELTAEAGSALIAFTANTACEVEFSVRGRYK